MSQSHPDTVNAAIPHVCAAVQNAIVHGDERRRNEMLHVARSEMYLKSIVELLRLAEQQGMTIPLMVYWTIPNRPSAGFFLQRDLLFTLRMLAIERFTTLTYAFKRMPSPPP